MTFVGILQFVIYILILVWLLKKKSGEKYSRKSMLRFWVCGADRYRYQDQQMEEERRKTGTAGRTCC